MIAADLVDAQAKCSSLSKCVEEKSKALEQLEEDLRQVNTATRHHSVSQRQSSLAIFPQQSGHETEQQQQVTPL